MPKRRLILILLLAPILCGLFFLGHLGWFLTVDSGDVKGDVIVVLGGSADGRAERAAELYRHGVAGTVLVSGYGDNEVNKAILIQNGVPSGAIILETRSRSTYENAHFSLPILQSLGAHRVIVVTSWYHSRRALACFQTCTSDITVFSRPAYEDYGQWRERGVLSELPKILGYWVFYGICPLRW